MFVKNVKDVGLDPMQDVMGTLTDWPLEFERQQRSILELWQTCNVSLIHRTYFVLLFKGDPMDSIYMEVELRRLSFLKETFSRGGPAVEDGRALTLASRSFLSPLVSVLYVCVVRYICKVNNSCLYWLLHLFADFLYFVLNHTSCKVSLYSCYQVENVACILVACEQLNADLHVQIL